MYIISTPDEHGHTRVYRCRYGIELNDLAQLLVHDRALGWISPQMALCLEAQLIDCMEQHQEYVNWQFAQAVNQAVNTIARRCIPFALMLVVVSVLL
jgi:hypothetical protein